MKAAKLLGVAPLQIAQAVIGFGAIAAFTRLMTPDEFGRYALALSVSMFAHTLTFTWAESAAYRFFAAARAEDQLKNHFATLLGLALSVAAAALLATAAMLLLFGATRDLATLCVFAAGSAAFRFLTRIARETERAELALVRYALTETVYLGLGFAAGLALLIKFDLGAAAPFGGLLLSGVVVFSFDAVRLFLRAEGGVVSVPRARKYAAYGAPLALAIAVDLGVQAIVRIVIAREAGEAALGSYAAAFGLARPLDLLFVSAGAALTPQLLAAYEEHGREAARGAARNIFFVVAALAIPAAFGLALVATPLSSLMVGSALAPEAARALPWLAFSGLFAGFNLYYWSEAFQLTRRTGVRALLMLAPGLLQIGLTAKLAPLYGATGAAIAALASALLGSLLLALYGRFLFALPLPRREATKILLASLLMAVEIIAFPQHDGALGLAATVGVGLLAYMIAALALDLLQARAFAQAAFQFLWRFVPQGRSHAAG